MSELINNLLRSKLNWWSRFWQRRIKIVKVKSNDSLYLEHLDGIRKAIVRNNEVGGQEDAPYQVYLDKVRSYLKFNKKRLLTKQEEKIVIVHLKVAALAYCNEPDAYDGLDITQILCIETARKVSELHPDMETPTEEEVDQKAAEALTVQNFLSE